MNIGLVCPASLPATQFGGILFLAVDIARESTKLGNNAVIYTTNLDFANNAASISVRRQGAALSAPNRDEVNNLY